MPRLKLSEWSAMADIAAAVAVVASLLFVGMELHDNTEAQRSRNERTLVNSLVSLEMNRVTDREFATLMLRAEGGDELDPVDASRVEALAYLYIDNWELAFHDLEKGLIDPDMWAALDDWLREEMKSNYFREAVVEAAESGTYSSDFAAHLRDVLAQSEAR